MSYSPYITIALKNILCPNPTGIGSKLKKAAVIGAVAYGGYQLGKLSTGFGNYGWAHQHGYSFKTWNRDRKAAGMLCRNAKDCKWIDDKYSSFFYHF